MSEIVSVRFKKAGKLCSFDTAGIALKPGDQVIVETARGLEMGTVVNAPQPPTEADKQCKPLLRAATAEDISQATRSQEMEEAALVTCRETVTQLGLPMKLIGAEYNLDASRLTIYFCAQSRVDFRDLVRQLAGSLKTRVELRQVGPRDEAKLCASLGRCGRPLCCASFITEFNPVSIKMAKEQDLPLNPPKISGLCGRLLCCLAYEYDSYHTMREGLPKSGKMVDTPHGPAKMLGANVPKQTVTVQLESQAVVEIPLKEIQAAKVPQKPSPKSEKGDGKPPAQKPRGPDRPASPSS